MRLSSFLVVFLAVSVAGGGPADDAGPGADVGRHSTSRSAGGTGNRDGAADSGRVHKSNRRPRSDGADACWGARSKRAATRQAGRLFPAFRPAPTKHARCSDNHQVVAADCGDGAPRLACG